LRRQDSFVVEIDGNPLQRITGGVPLENSSHRDRLVRIHRKLDARDHWSAVAIALGATLDRHSPISEDAAAGVQSVEGELLDATKGSLRQILEVKRIHDAVDPDEEFGLLTAGVNALGDVDHTNAGKLQLFDDAQRVLKAAAHAACVVGQDDIERPWFSSRGGQETLQPGAVVRRS
jgi:hypothetical protein